MDWKTNKLHCAITNPTLRAERLKVSPDGKTVAIFGCEFNERGWIDFYWELYRSGIRVEPPLKQPRFLDFSPTESLAILATPFVAVVEDLADQKRKLTFRPDKNFVIVAVSFDSESSPKALLSGIVDDVLALELWDLSNNVRIWKSFDFAKAPYRYEMASHIRVEESHSLRTRFLSMADGRPVDNLPIYNGEYSGFGEMPHPGNGKTRFLQWYELSPDGRYYLDERFRPSVLDSLKPASSSNGWLSQQLSWLRHSIPFFHSSTDWILQDALAESRRWNTKPGSFACFRECDACLTTFDDEGVYDWDLPPRQRWFTPWAWPALAATLTLIWYLWPWERRKAKASMA